MFRHCHPCIDLFFVWLFQVLVDEANHLLDAYFRRSPHLDEKAYPPQEAPMPPRFAAHDLPILIPPPR